uniref:Uncharacterized protein n=1 Tax=Anguilla anguilla TaxID=7936 RepID=A0A0E9UIP7_ANGAN
MGLYKPANKNALTSIGDPVMVLCCSLACEVN